MLSLSTAASPPPPPPPPPRLLLCCYAITSAPAASRRGSEEIPLTRQKAAGSTRTSPTERPALFGRARPAIDPGEGREKSGRCKGKARTGGGGDKIHMERRGERKGRRGDVRTHGKAPWADLWRPDTGCWAQTRSPPLAGSSQRVSGPAALILG